MAKPAYLIEPTLNILINTYFSKPYPKYDEDKIHLIDTIVDFSLGNLSAMQSRILCKFTLMIWMPMN